MTAQRRFAAGTFAVGTPSVRPCESREVLDLSTADGTHLWTVGFSQAETMVTSVPGVPAKLVTVGCCLATDTELRGALAAAAEGDLGPALRLPGSYLTLLRTESGLRVAGDRSGVVPVYWLPHEGGIWWSTAATALAALTGLPAHLPVLVADLVVTGVDTRLDQAHFEGVRRVPPGHVLQLDTAHEPQVAPIELPENSGLAQGIQLLRGALETAVVRRVDAVERASADLSGGVDSSLVTCLAARTKPLVAVTYTDAHTAEEDDVRYARRIARDIGSITHHVIDGRQADTAEFDDLAEPAALPVTDTPALALGVLAMKGAQLAPAVAHSSEIHLTGRGGDNVLQAAHSHSVDAFLAGQPFPALRSAANFARAQRVAVWELWWQLASTAATPYSHGLERLVDRLTSARSGRSLPSPAVQCLAWCGVTAAASWLTRHGRQIVADLVRARAQKADADITPAVLHDRLMLEAMASSHAAFDAIARQRWNLPVHAPLLDTTVVDACLSVPSYLRVRPGIYKPLARAAFTGLAPSYLLNRATKTAFTSSMYTGLRVNAPVLRSIIDSSRLAAAGLIDAHRAASDLERALVGGSAPLACLHTLIVTELWLTRLDTTRAEWWQTNSGRNTACS